MVYIIYIVDSETTGIDSSKHEIIELSMCRLLLDSSKEEQKTWLLQATNEETIEIEALNISGHKREDVLCISDYGKENYIHPKKVLPEIENWIAEDDVSSGDRIVVGQNTEFDFKMMESLWKRHNCYDTFPFQTEPNKLILDTKIMAILIDLCTGKKRERYNLGSLVKSFGVKKRQAHRAAEDVQMTKDLFIKQISPIKNILLETFKDSY